MGYGPSRGYGKPNGYEVRKECGMDLMIARAGSKLESKLEVGADVTAFIKADFGTGVDCGSPVSADAGSGAGVGSDSGVGADVGSDAAVGAGRCS